MKTNRRIWLKVIMFLCIVLFSNCENESENEIVYGTITDPRDSTVYKTVIIGNQEWMAENLKYLPFVSGPSEGSLNEPYYYVYGYEGSNAMDAKASENYIIYGVLYNWSAALTACPAGWHLPSHQEWTELSNFLGNYVGIKIKEKGTVYWIKNSGATNETGFTALPGGWYRYFMEDFFEIGERASWWSSTQYFNNQVWATYMVYYLNGLFNTAPNMWDGLSVRCVKD